MTRSTRIRLLAAVAVTVALLTGLLGPVGTPASATSDVETERVGGADRFETAANVARKAHPSSGTALIASGTNFPDALAGSMLAGAVGAPILLVMPTSIPAATAQALDDIGVNDVIILGGPNAVGPGVEANLRQNYSVTRVQGDDRYKTAVEIARRAAISGIGTVDGLRTAFVTTGLNFPDALGAGPLAYEGDLPVFLTRPTDLPPEVAQAIRDLNIEHVVILGGTQAVSGNVEAQIKAIGVTTERLSGRNRAETATFVADFALARMGFEGVNTILARGDNFPDALAGGPLGGERRAVMLLTATSCQLAIETRRWLEDHFGTVARIIALGGTAAICQAVLNEAEAAAETNNIPPDRVDLTISGGSMNGGPQWQYQESDASPSKSLTLSAFVSSDPGDGAPNDAERVPAAREDVVFNIRPTQGDAAGNGELNLTARTDSNGVARISYTRGNPGTDTITVRLSDDSSVSDDGTGRWGTATMPMSLAPDTSQTLEAGQEREFTVCVPGPEGGVPSLGGQEINLTTLELVDDDPTNDTNTAALILTDVDDDRADTDETFGHVTTLEPDGCAVFSIGSNAAQIFTLMGFIDSVNTPAANDDNTNPTEFRDLAGPTAFASDAAAVSISPPTDNSDACPTSGTCIDRRNGQQIVYTVTAVDPQGQAFSGPVDVSFRQLTDNSAITTTTAEFDWFDNSDTPSTQEGFENDVPPGATATGAGTTRIELIPNDQGKFTFAITHPLQNTNETTGNPIAWIDIPGGTNNRPDSTEPQAVGENFRFRLTNLVTATLESLGCPPGTDQRGFPGGNNPTTIQDPCLGRDVLAADPHIPWPLDAAPTSASSNAATSDETGQPDAATISRGDIVFRFTYRDATGRPSGTGDVVFEVSHNGAATSTISAAPNRPNDDSATPVAVPGGTGAVGVPIVVEIQNSIAEIVVDSSAVNTGGAPRTVTVRARIEDATPDAPLTCVPANTEGFCLDTAQWVGVSTDTTSAEPLTGFPTATQCPAVGQPCFNGNVIAIDKARNSYVMNRGTFDGGTAYVVYAAGGGGELYDGAVALQGERKSNADEYFLDGVRAPADADDRERCDPRLFNPSPAFLPAPGCAQFDNALSFDDRMVYEFTRPPAPPFMVQTHFLTNGTAP